MRAGYGAIKEDENSYHSTGVRRPSSQGRRTDKIVRRHAPRRHGHTDETRLRATKIGVFVRERRSEVYSASERMSPTH